MNRSHSKELFERAQKVIPGGVNSPVRAYQSVGGYPPFIDRAKGALIYDTDGNEYIDYVGSWGPMILGHSHPQVLEGVKRVLDKGSSFGAPVEAEIRLAEMIVERVPSAEMVRLVNSGTEATMSAVRLARGYTARDKMIKFQGCYHGHGDSFLISAGSGALTLGVPDSPGVTKGTAADTLLAEFNDIDSVKEIFEKFPNDIACIIVEPINGNAGTIPPQEGFLQGLREVCDNYGSLLIFDEVMTGFRVARGGANELYGVDADLLTFGKIIGGGFPIGAYGGKKEIMLHIAPAGNIYQAGTLSGNPVAVQAGIETLNLLDVPAYEKLEKLGAYYEEKILEIIKKSGQELSFHRVGSMFTLFFTEGPIQNINDVKKADIQRFKKGFNYLLEKGIYMAPSQYEAAFISLAHTENMIDRTLKIIEESLIA